MFPRMNATGVVILLMVVFSCAILAQESLAQPSDPQQDPMKQPQAGEPLPPEDPSKPTRTTLPVALPAVPLAAFSALLKEAVLHNLPEKIAVENHHNWGHQAQILSVQTVKVIHVMRNHGNWEKARTIAPDLSHNLNLHGYGLFSPREDLIVFTVRLELPATVELEHNIWQNGIEVFASRGRARLQLRADVTLESNRTPKSEGGSSLEGVAEFTLTGARVYCDDFVAENIDGIGGDVARTAGGLLHRSFKPCQPGIEAAFQKKLCNAILNAGGVPEVRIGLRKVLSDSMAARTTFLQAQIAATTLEDSSTEFAPEWMSRPPTQSVPACLPYGGLLLELQLLGSSGHAAPPAHTAHSVHVIQYNHSSSLHIPVHVESAAHFSSTHVEPAAHSSSSTHEEHLHRK